LNIFYFTSFSSCLVLLSDLIFLLHLLSSPIPPLPDTSSCHGAY
jgi:hypothetical protein